MSESGKKSPWDGNAAYEEMYPKWQLASSLRDLDDIKKYNSEYLPKNPGESKENYGARVKRTTLKTFSENTVQAIVAKPFERVISIDNLPPQLEPFITNVDGKGSSINEFSMQLFEDGVRDGKAHVLTDNQNAEETGDTTPSPYWRLYKAEDVPQWEDGDGNRGQSLTRVNLREIVSKVDPENDWDMIAEKQVLVFRCQDGTVTWKRYIETKQGSNEYNISPENGAGTVSVTPAGKNSMSFDSIPIETFYTNRTGQMKARPPLLGQMRTNLEHYQVGSQHSEELYMISGVWVITGLDTEDKTFILPLGPGAIGKIPDGASIEPKEKAGIAEKAQREWMQHDEQLMIMEGLEPFQRDVEISATEANNEQKNATSKIKRWIRSCEETIKRSLVRAGKFLSIEDSALENIEVKIYSEFTDITLNANMLNFIKSLADSGHIRAETLLDITQRQGMVPADLDIDEEVKQASLSFDNSLAKVDKGNI